MRKTNIQPYTLKWEQAYLKEEQLLKGIFKGEIIHIFHIGSTSVAAIRYAKPIIDILIEVKDIDNVELKNHEMQQNGYEVKGENGITGRRYFTKRRGNTSTHHVHIYETGNQRIKEHLAFKRYLQAHPKLANQYGQLKMALQGKFPDNHYQYQEGKQEFVTEIALKAKLWAKEQELF